MRALYVFLAVAATLLVAPTVGATMADTYEAFQEDGAPYDFIGYGCQPTQTEPPGSGARTPRADIMGFEIAGRSGLEARFATSVIDFRVTGTQNINTDETAVLGDPRDLPGGDAPRNFDYNSALSLGRAGWVAVVMADDIVADGGPGEELIVWEAAHSEDGGPASSLNPSPTASEPFCVYGRSAAGPWFYVGLWLPPQATGVDKATFDLDAYYRTFSGQATLRHVMVLDSGQSQPIIEPRIKIQRANDLTQTQHLFIDDTHPSLTPAGTTGTWTLRTIASASNVDRTLTWTKDTPISHTFTRNGSYEVCLYLQNGQAEGTSCRTFTVENRLPTVVVSAATTTPHRGQAVQFTATGNDAETPVRYAWFLDDATTHFASGPQATLTFAALVSHTVMVRVTDGDAGTAEAELAITVVDQHPVASFDIQPHPRATGFTIQFTDRSTDPDGDALSYQWDFDDGTAAKTVPSPTHVYSANGEYEVSLTVSAMGNASSFTRTVIIDNDAPVVAIAGPVEVFTGQDVVWTDASTDADGISQWAWRLGDIKTGDTSSLHHRFADGGVHTLELTVWDSRGAWNTLTKTITVTNRPPTVEALLLEDPGATRKPYRFDFTGSDQDGRIVSWLWNFGDGRQSGDPRPSHAYTATGQYTVTLTVTDDDGDTATSQLTLNVQNEAPWPEIGREADDVPGVVHFRDLSRDRDGTIAWREWDLGDGTTSQAGSFTHTFASASTTYTVSLRIRDDYGTEVVLIQYLRPDALAPPGFDSDGDGVPDSRDVCPAQPDPEQSDLDGDGIGDACDDDRDGDGVPNSLDRFPDDPLESEDLDGDGIGDNLDTDDDGDGLPDTAELTLGTDPRRADSDGDGVPDGEEVRLGHDPLDPRSPARAPPKAWVEEGPPVVIRWTAASDPRVTGYRVVAEDGRLVATVDGATFAVVDDVGSSAYRVDAMAGDQVLGSTSATVPACTDCARDAFVWWPFAAGAGGVAILAGVAVGVHKWRQREPEIAWRKT